MPQAKDSSKILIINITDDFVTGFLYSLDRNQLQLLETSRYRRVLDYQQLVESIQYEFRERFDEVQIVTKQDEWLGNAIDDLYPDGVVVGIEINGAQTIVSTSSWGRIDKTKTYNWGTAAGLDDLFDRDGLTRLQNWLKVNGREGITGDLINYLGSRKLYPGLKQNPAEIQEIIIGLLQTILFKITQDEPMLLREESVSSSKGAHRVVFTGDLALELQEYGSAMLSIIDGLDLRGYWEIIIDTKALIPSLGFTKLGNRIFHEELGIISLGSVIIPQHNYGWGEYLGELKLDLGLSEDQIVELKSGEIIRLPLDRSQKGAIDLKVRHDVEITGYQGLEQINGGVIGLIIDARGRPLPALNNLDQYRQMYEHWQEALQ